MADPTADEARRRIRKAAGLVASAIRLGGSAREVYRAIEDAVHEGADLYAEDVKDEWRGASGC